METVSRSLRLMKKIAEQPMTVSEVADEFGMHKSTASRVLATLKNEHFLRLTSKNKYALGYAIFELADALRESLDLRFVARPYMQELNSITGETIHLGVYEQGEVVYVDKIDCNRSIRMYSRAGKRASASCTALGKALLAYQPPHELNLDQWKFKRFTENTIITPVALLKELQAIRQNGLAWDRGEHEEDIYCISAPVFDSNSLVIASISIAITIKYTSLEKLASFTDDLQRTTSSISLAMGFTGCYPFYNRET